MDLKENRIIMVFLNDYSVRGLIVYPDILRTYGLRFQKYLQNVSYFFRLPDSMDVFRPLHMTSTAKRPFHMLFVHI